MWFDDQIVNALPPHRRDVAMVFQSYALYPHKTVYENIAFGLRMRRGRGAEIDRRVRDAAAKLAIAHLLQRRPSQLSGGQRQRVALGRAMVRQPSVFLMDEPLSNLDAALRISMRAEIKHLHTADADHLRLRDPRSGRGADARRPHRGDEGWRHAANRHTGRNL